MTRQSNTMLAIPGEFDFNNYCANCGALLPQDRYESIREYCSPACRNAVNNARLRRGREIVTNCEWCGAELPKGKYASNRRFCNERCYHADYQAMLTAALIESKKDRPGCAECGSPIAPERFALMTYCSKKCSRRAAYKRFKARLDATRQGRTCLHCSAPIPASSEAHQVYCCAACMRAADYARRRAERRPGGRLRLTPTRLDRLLGVWRPARRYLTPDRLDQLLAKVSP